MVDDIVIHRQSRAEEKVQLEVAERVSRPPTVVRPFQRALPRSSLLFLLVAAESACRVAKGCTCEIKWEKMLPYSYTLTQAAQASYWNTQPRC